jgi:hypothetical protein
MLYEATGSELNLEVAHFSGYWMIWPLKMEDSRIFANDRQADVERRLQNQLAVLFAFRRLRELFGLEVAKLDVVLRNLLPEFEREVLDGRLALAGDGCAEARLAMEAFLAYDRQLQLIVADDRALYDEFKRPIPPALWTLAWNLCLDEEYERCAALGEFPRLVAFLWTQGRQRDFAGLPLSTEEINDGLDRLQRCGRWRVTIDAWSLDQGAIGRVERETVSEFELSWKPGEGGPEEDTFRLVTSKIEGSGDPEVKKYTMVFLGDAVRQANFQTAGPATARIEGMAFEQPIGTADMEPVPRELRLFVFPGTLQLDRFSYPPQHIEVDMWPGGHAIFGDYVSAFTIAKGWQFSARPFKATVELDGREPYAQIQGTRSARLEITLEHTPG